jgi:hypothetical protein
MICPTGEAKYFCKWGWTGKSEPRPTGKSVQSAGDAQRGPDEFRALQLRTREADYCSLEFGTAITKQLSGAIHCSFLCEQ